MRTRVAFVALAALAAFLAAYAVGQAEERSATAARPAAAIAVTAGKKAPVSRAVPIPATARLPELRDAPAAPTRRTAAVLRRRAPAAAPAAAPAPAPKPAPKPDTGTPFFDAE